jgi:hypothetical protein
MKADIVMRSGTVRVVLSRRHAIAAAVSLLISPRHAFADEIINLTWEELLPEGSTSFPAPLRGIIEHEQGALISQQPGSAGLRADWNGKKVRLPGYVVPLEFDGTAVTSFILVPFVGACVHVPPPPANQLVLVTPVEPYEGTGLFEPVQVTGTFGTAAMTTQLAEVGYVLSADEIEPFPS